MFKKKNKTALSPEDQAAVASVVDAARAETDPDAAPAKESEGAQSETISGREIELPDAVKKRHKKLQNKKRKRSTEMVGDAEAEATAAAEDVLQDEEKPAVFCDNLVKIYKTDDIEVIALQGLDLKIQYGEILAIIGNSGSGKSTLMNMIGGLDRPSAGQIFVLGYNMNKLSESSLVSYKRDKVGFVWQNNARNLIPYLTALENVEIPMIISGAKNRRERAKQLLDAVGLSHRYNSKLSQLSGGEQQRTAIAIALANEPQILLADEPTGAVDTTTSNMIFDLFRKFNRELGITIIIVTHDPRLAMKVDRVVNIRDGRISSEMLRHNAYLEELNRIKAGNEEGLNQTHAEYVVVDRNGHMQIPPDFVEAIGLKGKSKVKIERVDDRLMLYVPDEDKEGDAAEKIKERGE